MNRIERIEAQIRDNFDRAGVLFETAKDIILNSDATPEGKSQIESILREARKLKSDTMQLIESVKQLEEEADNEPS